MALGMGLGLLLADRFSASQRRAVGGTRLRIGALTTIPFAFEVLGGSRLSTTERSQPIGSGQRSTTDQRSRHSEFAQI